MNCKRCGSEDFEAVRTELVDGSPAKARKCKGCGVVGVDKEDAQRAAHLHFKGVRASRNKRP